MNSMGNTVSAALRQVLERIPDRGDRVNGRFRYRSGEAIPRDGRLECTFN